MGTLENIRNRAGVLVTVVIGLALVAFILGDILGTGGQSLFTRTQFEIAEIAGKSISYQNFQERFDNLAEIYRLNTGEESLDEGTRSELLDDTWEMLLREIILEEEYQEIGLAVTSEEMYDMIRGEHIHPIVRQLFTDPSTGMFDEEHVTQFLRSMDQDPSGQQRAYWLYIENEIMRERKKTKYNNLLNKGLYITSLEAENAAQNRNRRVDFEFISKPYTTISDDEVEVSNSEIRRYYRRNSDKFHQEASRDIEYVSFDVEPSEEDDIEAREWIENIKDDFREVETDRLSQFVRANSDEPFDRTNYSYGELPDEINDFMFNADPGDIYGPYFDEGDNTYKLARLAEINYMPDSVRARHILIQPDRELSHEEADELAGELLDKINRGESFEELAIEHSQDGGSRFEGGDLGWFSQGEMIEEFSRASFEADIGETFIVETDFGFHVVEILNRSSEVKKVQVAKLVREVVPGSDTYQEVYRKAVEFAGNANTYEDFVNIIEKEGLTKRTANNVRASDRSIPGFESPRELIRWAFEAEEHDVSSILELQDRFVIAAIPEVREEGTRPLEEVRDEIVRSIRKEKKGEKIAGELRRQINEAGSFEELAQSLNKQIEEASGISFTSFSVPGAGTEPKLIGAAVSLESGEMSPPVTGENGVYVVRLNDTYLTQEPDYEREKERLRDAARSRVNNEAFEALKKLADIKDKRYKFF